MNCPQHSERFKLDEALADMRSFGIATPEYIIGYSHGFEDTVSERGTRSDSYLAYERGLRAGRDACWRGAHDEKRGS